MKQIKNENVLIERMKHALGFGRRNPYTRHGKKFFKPYRNYYAMVPDELMEDAVKEGILSRNQGEKLVYYRVTPDGRKWLGEKLGVVIHDED